MNDDNLIIKRRYEAMLHRLKSQQIERLMRLTRGLENPDVELSELQEVVEKFTHTEASFMTFQKVIGEYIKSLDLPPRGVPLRGRTEKDMKIGAEDVAAKVNPPRPKRITPEKSPALRRSLEAQANKEDTATTQNNEETKE